MLTFWDKRLSSKAGCQLTIGPLLERGFYYDAFYGSDKKSMTAEDATAVGNKATEIIKEGQKHARLELTKEEALLTDHQQSP